MSDQPTPAAPGAAAPVVPIPAQAGDTAANAAFAQMRTELAALKAQNDALAAEKTALERKDMDEKTRMAAELADAQKLAQELTPVREALTRYQSQLETACTNELATIPEEKRAAIEAVVAQIPLEGRLTAIQSMRSAIGSAPLTAGTPTAPGASPGAGIAGPEGPPKPLDAKELRRTGWGDALKAHSGNGNVGAVIPDINALVEAAVEKRLAAR